MSRTLAYLPPISKFLIISTIFAIGCTRAPGDTDRGAAPLESRPRGLVPEAARPRVPAQPARTATNPPATPPTIDLALTAWRWQTRPDDKEFPQVRDARGPHDVRFQFEATREPDRALVRRVESDGSVAWTREFPSEFVDGGFLLHHQGRVLLAHHSHIASGCKLHALDAETGEIAWSTVLRALGPVSHSKYRNRVQMRVLGDAAVVYGFEAQGRYVEVVDLATGKTRDNVKVSSEIAEVPWQWHTPERRSFRAGPTTASAPGGGSYLYTPGALGKHATIARRDRAGATQWTADIEGEGDCGNAAMVEHDGVAYAAHWCSIATGGRLLALDGKTGRARWQVTLEALPGVGHSEYWADIEVRVLHGHVAVFGLEAAGRYIELRDPKTGALASSQVFWQ